MIQLWNAFYRRKLLVLACVLCCIATAVVVTHKQDHVYQARTAIEFQGLDDNLPVNIPQLGGAAPAQASDDSYIQTQVAIMQSRSFVARVANKLGMDHGVNPKQTPGLLAKFGQILGFPPKPPLPFDQQVLQEALSSLTVRPNRQTRIVELLYDSSDPKLAANFLNTLVAEYSEQSLENRWKSGERTSDWLTEKLSELRVKLEDSADRLQRYAADNDLVQYGGENNSVSDERLRQLQAELSRAQADRVLKQAQVEAAQGIAPKSVAEVLDKDALRGTQARLAELRAQLADLSSLLTPENYKVKRVQAQIAALEESLEQERGSAVDRIRVQAESAQRRESLLSRAYVEQEKRVHVDALKAIRYDLLKREVDANRQLYDSMLQKIKESRIASAMRASNVRVIDPAEPPFLPYRPNVFFNLSMGLVGGLLLGVTAAFVADQFDSTLRQPGDMAACLSVPALGMIPVAKLDPAYRESPRIGSHTRKRSLLTVGGEVIDNGSPEIRVWETGGSLITESFRSLAASIVLPRGGYAPKVLLMTSARPKEGKSTVIANLGIVLARMNKRVLLIDGDVRRSRLHAMFGVARAPGLRDFLLSDDDNTSAEGGIDHLVRATHIRNLFVLPSGEGSDEVVNLFHSPRLLDLFGAARLSFDYILVDTPPVLYLPDARALGQFTDAAILLIRAGDTSRDIAVEALRRLIDDSTPILGTILNHWDPRDADGDYLRHYIEYFRENSTT